MRKNFGPVPNAPNGRFWSLLSWTFPVCSCSTPQVVVSDVQPLVKSSFGAWELSPNDFFDFAPPPPLGFPIYGVCVWGGGGKNSLRIVGTVR